MPDFRKHRGPHPADEKLFDQSQLTVLTAAVADLSWLLTKQYSAPSALKLVGDRYALEARQRTAVMRSSSATAAVQLRASKHRPVDQLAGLDMAIDGFNLLTLLEAAMSGAVLIIGRDGCYRDMASMHGNYRKVSETLPALILIGEELQRLQLASVTWWLDRPVSNSGRLAQIIEQLAQEHDWPWQATLVYDVDAQLKKTNDIVVSSDAAILDECGQWSNLAAHLVAQLPEPLWILDLGTAGEAGIRG